MMQMNVLKWRNLVKRLYLRCIASAVQRSEPVFLQNLSATRSVIRVAGDQVESFLQGLITNDIGHIATRNTDCCMFSMFLNKPGRVLYDVIVFKRKSDENAFFIECDRTIDENLKRHLQLFRVRKKIDVDIVRDEFNIWVAFQRQPSGESRKDDDNTAELLSHITHCTDPRLNSLGSRILAAADQRENDLRQLWPGSKCELSTPQYDYKQHRYVFGVGEGVQEITSEKIFPFEANCDYLHGISFHKGCYLGQEFTARTYHTGVIRKRIMPILLAAGGVTSDSLPLDTPIINEDNKPVGKLKGIRDKHAIGVLKVDLALSSKKLMFGGVEGTTFRPNWWPQQMDPPKTSAST